MSYNLIDIYKYSDLSMCRLLTGSSGFSTPVTSCEWSGLHDGRIRGSKNCLMISKLKPSVLSDPGLCSKTVPALSAGGCSGLVLKNAAEEIPKEMLEEAERLKFPVFTMPKDLSVNSLISSILRFVIQEASSQQFSVSESCFMDLISDNISTESEARQRAEYLKWIAPPFSLMLFDVRSFAQIAEDKTEAEILRFKEQVKACIESRLLEFSRSSLVHVQNDSFLYLCRNTDRAALLEAAEGIRDQVKEDLDISLYIGISDPCKSYLDIAQANRQVLAARYIARNRGIPIVHIHDADLENALIWCGDKRSLADFSISKLRPILEYDRENGTNLIRTATVLAQNLGRRSETAEKLYIHRNTLNSRIKILEQICGTDLGEGPALLDLAFALKIYNIPSYREEMRGLQK